MNQKSQQVLMEAAWEGLQEPEQREEGEEGSFHVK